MKTYRLSAKVEGRWKAIATVRAETHTEGFREAMVVLPTEFYIHPIRLEQITKSKRKKRP